MEVCDWWHSSWSGKPCLTIISGKRLEISVFDFSAHANPALHFTRDLDASVVAVAKSLNASGGEIKYPATSAAAALAMDFFFSLERVNGFVCMKWSSRTLSHHTEIEMDRRRSQTTEDDSYKP